MGTRLNVKSSVALLMHLAGVDRWKIRRNSIDCSAILMYHRVLPGAAAEGVQPGMFVHPETLDLHIEYIQRHFDVVPLSSLAPRTAATAKNDRGRLPKVALTFDDGWLDFYVHAFPILQRRKVPATVFLPTNYIGTNRWFWTDRLARLLGRISPIAVKGIRMRSANQTARTILHLNGNFKRRIESAIAILKPLRLEAIEDALEEIEALAGESPDPHGRAFLNWEEVSELYGSGIVHFGSHTASHSILTTLTDAEARRELRTSASVLREHKIVDPAFIPFCYPNGAVSTRIAELTCDAGYHLAVTTQRGWVRPNANPYTLRRIGLHQDMSSTRAMFTARLAGLL
jgi:peptidoglycan/xylan/chitin deacetylase (PgdA/CDA1 family)